MAHPFTKVSFLFANRLTRFFVDTRAGEGTDVISPRQFLSVPLTLFRP
jgi:hypothetical protein